MAKLPRVTQPIFAENAANNGVFGSAQDNGGAGDVATDIANAMSLPAWAQGWLDAIIGASKFPPLEEFQTLTWVMSSQLAYILQQGMPEYDVATEYFTNNIVVKTGTYELYGSLVNANLGNPLPAAVSDANWEYLGSLSDLSSGGSFFTGGTSTGSANAQVLSPVTPPGFSLSTNGATVACTAGFTNTGATTFDIDGTGATNVQQDSGGGLVDLTGGEIVAGTTIFLTVNTAAGVLVLTDAPTLGDLAALNLGTPAGLLYEDTGTLKSYVPTNINGLIPTSITGNSTTAAVTIDAGQASDSTNLQQLISPSGFAWAVSNGNAANGYQGGTTLPSSDTIHMFLCSGSSGVCSFGHNGLTPTPPAGYDDYFRRIFSFTTDNTGTPQSYTATEGAGGSLIAQLDSIVSQTEATTSSASTVTISGVPNDIIVQPRARVTNGTNAIAVLWSSLSAADAAVGDNGTAPGSTTYAPGAQLPNTLSSILTNTSGQVRVRGDGVTDSYLYLDGWEDFRR